MSLTEKEQNTELLSWVVIALTIIMGFFHTSLYLLLPVVCVSSWIYSRIRSNVILQFERNFVGALIALVFSQTVLVSLLYGVGYCMSLAYQTLF